jgi:crotonobetainyl-CoA:carnitine CoA-transferase CaiB-like acyl-CoA transferase
MNDSGSTAVASADATDVRGPLAGVLVVEHGDRLGASICGTLLAQLGADVVFVERSTAAAHGADANVRVLRAIGKHSLLLQAGAPDDDRLAVALVSAADIVIASSDTSRVPDYDGRPEQIVCDVTAFGSTGPLAGLAHSDALVQALSGLADTTGDPEGPPALIGLPFCEISAGLYAAAAILVAHRVLRTRGFGQRVDIALFDCAVTALSTFLPFHAIGKPVTRSGNRHSLAAPWNAYRAADGWVLICTATDEQWTRLCALIGQPELATAPGFVKNADRVGRRGEVDAVLERWTRTNSIEQCIAKLSAIEIACGPIVSVPDLRAEPNLILRNMLLQTEDRDTGEKLPIPGSPLAASMPFANATPRIPRADEDRAHVARLLEKRVTQRKAPVEDSGSPLAGLRVVEIGQYTTAPLVARQLGALGAEVFKIEPPGGEGSRAWPPVQGNRGYFFAFSNSDKKSVELDLRDSEHRKLFVALLRTADVLVENLKPGSLARLGFTAEELRRINPRLVYCGISGFGARSAYPGRPAFDTVVQAMSGIMDLTRVAGVPTKAGISAADIIGGEFGLLAILAALSMRDISGEGCAIDISMQDCAAWATATVWNGSSRGGCSFVKCADGYVCIDGAAEADLVALDIEPGKAQAVSALTRDALVVRASDAGLSAAPVRTVSEVAASDQVAARELIITKSTADGRKWPLLNSPLRLARTPPAVREPIGELGAANADLHALR